MQYCVDTYLVGLDRELPTDPSVAYSGKPPVFGCNNLVCANCNAVVRHADARSITTQYPPGDLERLYESADPESSPLLDASPRHAKSRAYFCRCDWYAVNFGGEKWLAHMDQIWRCGGHSKTT
jgi:hypothetical protein